MKKNVIKEKLRAGEAVVGTFCNLPSPAAAELLGVAGFDYIIIDAEHSPVDLDTCEHMVRACDASGMAAMVRVALNLPQNILRYLDTGVVGVQIPMVNSKEEAEMVVAATKYPPLGRRGLAANRATKYGTNIDLAEYVREANQETLVCVQVETTEALARTEEIASVDLVDLVFLGPTDLSSAMGYPGQPTHPAGAGRHRGGREGDSGRRQGRRAQLREARRPTTTGGAGVSSTCAPASPTSSRQRAWTT